MHSTPRLGLVLTMLVALILAACSSPAASPSVAPATPEPASEAPATAAPTVAPASEAPASVAPSAPASGDALVAVGESDLGQILVDAEGKTLYLFTADTAGEPTCYDGCAAAWPPLLAEGEITVGEGLEAGDFSTVERTDGTMQVKIGEWPLYYFASDAAAGDTLGQGLNEKWYVVSPTGEAIE